MSYTKLSKLFMAATLPFCLLFSGCGAQEEDLSQRIEEFNASIRKAPIDVSANEGLVIGSVNMGMNGEWFSEVMNGIKDAANDLGVTIKMLDSDSNLDTERQNIDTLLNEGIDVLVISPISAEESIPAIQKVKDAGIPIVTWNTTVNTEVTASVNVDPGDLGGSTGNYVMEYIKTNNLDHVNLVILGNSTYDIGIARCEGFKNAIQDLVDQNVIHIIADEEAEFREEGASVARQLLQEHSDIDMIWAWNQGALTGCVDAVKELGRKDIIVMGTDMSMELADDMLGDTIDLEAVTTQLPYNMGYKAVVNAVDAAKGIEPEKIIWIPVSTYVREDRDRLEQYIENHKNLVQE